MGCWFKCGSLCPFHMSVPLKPLPIWSENGIHHGIYGSWNKRENTFYNLYLYKQVIQIITKIRKRKTANCIIITNFVILLNPLIFCIKISWSLSASALLVCLLLHCWSTMTCISCLGDNCTYSMASDRGLLYASNLYNKGSTKIADGPGICELWMWNVMF